MNKFILSASLVCLGLVGCGASQPAPVPVFTPPPPALVSLASPHATLAAPVAPVAAPAETPVSNEPQTLSGDHWSLVVPDGNWQQHRVGNPSILAMVGNSEVRLLVMLVAEPFTGSAENLSTSFGDKIKKQGGTVASTKLVKLNGMDTMYMVTNTADSDIFVWVTVKDNLGYHLLCGGPKGNADAAETCGTIASSLKIQ